MKQFWSNNELTEVEKCLESPIHFINNYVRIMNPRSREPIPFDLYSKQATVVNDIIKFDKNLLLTDRQVGGSSLICALALWESILYPNKQIVILSHNRFAAQDLNQKTRIMIDSLPEVFIRGLELVYRNKHTINFNNGSRIRFDSTTESSCRGINISSLYCDNFAFVKERMAEELFCSISPSLATGSKATFISCFNTAPNYFSRLWVDAASRLNTFNQLTLLRSDIHDEQEAKNALRRQSSTVSD